MNIAEYINDKRYTSLGKLNNNDLLELISFVEKEVRVETIKEIYNLVKNSNANNTYQFQCEMERVYEKELSKK